MIEEKQIKHRFSEACNSVYEVSSLEDLNEDKILQLVNDHILNQQPRLDELDDYYQVKNRTILKRGERGEGLANYKCAHGFARYISSFIQGYLVGNQIKVNHSNVKVNEALHKINAVTGMDKINADIILDLSVYGRAYDLVYRNRKDQDRVAVLSPLQTFVIYDDTVEKYPLMGIRYRRNAEGKLHVTAYTDTQIIEYSQDGEVLTEISRSPHSFGEVPITEYSNNRFRQGDFEPVLDQIDLYDSAQSDTANYMTDFNESILALFGNMTILNNAVQNMKNSRILLLEPGTDSNGKSAGNVDAKYLYKEYDVQGSEAYKNRIQNDIHKFTNTPDMNDEKFSGNASGESMKYKLFGLEQVRATKETLFKDSVLRRYRLICNLKTVAKELSDVDLTELKFVFTPNIPKSFYEEVRAFIELGGELSQETILTLTSLVDNAKKEMEKIEAENKKSVADYLTEQGRTFTDNAIQQVIPDGRET